MKKIVFATHNAHKLAEVQQLLAGKATVVGLTEIGCTTEIPETADTIAENARMKAEFVYENYGMDCFADDTGLEVEALNGAPGVYSARYAGEPANSLQNIEKLLRDMDGVTNRQAQFRTVIALMKNGEVAYFEGIVKGKIGYEQMGSEGFGYDPVFIPEGHDVSFAQMDAAAKNRISHRALAVQKLVSRFKEL